jgi:single-strand DNA-binding protein
MASINKVILIGNLGQDPELRYTQGGKAVASFSIATTERFSSRDGDRQERTEWHRIVTWERTAENCARFLSKGRSCFVEGRLQTREWEDKDGIKRRTTEVVAQNVQFLGGPRADVGSAEGLSDSPEEGSPAEPAPGSAPPPDDIPF